MFTNSLLLVLCFLNLISEGLNHVGQPCNKMFKICLASNSYCDEKNICRCKPDYPVNISLHSCKKGKQYSERCDYSEECYYYDNNSYCSQLPYRSTCECHTGFTYDELQRSCEKIGDTSLKTPASMFPIIVGISLSSLCIFCFSFIVYKLCSRYKVYCSFFTRSHLNSRSQYVPTNSDAQRPMPSAPNIDENLPTYDTLSLKISDDHEPPPSYDEVIGHISIPKA